VVTVGIVANPSAGKDIRRLVASGRVVPDQEKANTLQRVFAGLVAMGVDHVLVMPEPSGLARPAIDQFADEIVADYVHMPYAVEGIDSTRAARAMTDAEVACIVTLGGDGTNRVVAAGCRDVPIVPISTGTNNVFPQMVEGTLAGLAAGAVATGVVPHEIACRKSKRIEIFVDGKLTEIALVDAAVSRQLFAGARAIWDLRTVSSVFLTRAEPVSIGISSIGAYLQRVHLDDPVGLYFKLGDGDAPTQVVAPVGPGLVHRIGIDEWGVMNPGDRQVVEQRPGMLALDGEREVTLLPGRHVEVGLSLDGPRVVQIEATLEALSGARRP